MLNLPICNIVTSDTIIEIEKILNLNDSLTHIGCSITTEKIDEIMKRNTNNFEYSRFIKTKVAISND